MVPANLFAKLEYAPTVNLTEPWGVHALASPSRIRPPFSHAEVSPLTAEMTRTFLSPCFQYGE